MMKKEPVFVQKLQEASRDKGRVKFFLSFFLVSFIFWFFTKFSRQYTEVIDFVVSVDNIPASIIPLNGQEIQIEATLKATGFQFLYYQFIDNGLNANADFATFQQGKAVLPLMAEFQKLQDQLVGDTQIINLFPASIEFDYQVQQSKRIPVKAPQLNLPIGYRVTKIEFVPDSVELIGPADKLASIDHIVPVYLSNQQIKMQQSMMLPLPSFDSPLLMNTKKVQMNVSVDQYSEIEYQVKIQHLNAEGNTVVRFFPNKATLTFLAPLSEIKSLTTEDFVLGVDLGEGMEEKKKLTVRLVRSPEGLRNLRWEPKEVDYLIRQ